MESVWFESVKNEQIKTKNNLRGSIETEVLVIGGGMGGILCAYELKQRGISSVLLEAARLGSGTTGNTTAKITAQHGLIYADLIERAGIDAARDYYRANQNAAGRYRELSKEIPCDFEEKTAYTYSLSDRKKLEREAEAYRALGIAGNLKNSTPLPFRTAGALGMEGQVQFNPLKLLFGLAKELDIYEDTFVKKIDGNRAYTENGSILAKHIVLATHYPLVNIPGLYFLKLYQHRSYIIALQNAQNLDGMYLDERQNGHSFRTYGDLLLLGGGDHRTGKRGGGYEELRRLAKRAYPQSKEVFSWAAQDCMSLDGVPYIGVHRRTAPNLYVATGFNKWGMTGSMAASMVLADLISEGKSEYSKLFSPQRSMLRPELFSNIVHAVSGLLQFGKRCPHMGCALKWNAAEGTWDCPCHGSRFGRDGKLIDNPAKRDL